MNSDRGWYLVAVGVLALGIGNSSISDSVRGFLDRGVAVADNLSAEAMRAFAVAQLMSGRGEPSWAHAQATIARAQTRQALGVRLPPHCLRPRMEIGTSRTCNSPARV